MGRTVGRKARKVAGAGSDENTAARNTRAGQRVHTREAYAETREGNEVNGHGTTTQAKRRTTVKKKECRIQRLPLDWRVETIERLVERIAAIEPIRTALTNLQTFDVEVTCRQAVPDEELHATDRDWDPTGSRSYAVTAPNGDEARELALDRFGREVPIKIPDHYDMVAEIVEEGDE